MPNVQTPEMIIVQASGAQQTSRDGALKIIQEVSQDEHVATAVGQWERAKDRIGQLMTAARRINAALRDVLDELREIEGNACQTLINALGADGPDESEKLSKKLLQTRQRKELLLATLSRVMEHESPLADITELISHADYLDVLSSALQRVGHERMAATMEAMRDVIGAEGQVAFDPSSTLSGAILQQAQQFYNESVGYRSTAAELKQTYEKRCREIAGSGQKVN